MAIEHQHARPKQLSRNQTEVLSCLRAAREPLSAYAILDRVRPSGIAHPPTVYRALSELMQLGKVHRLQSRSAFVACDHGGCDGKFAFAICRECQKVLEIPLSNEDHAALAALSPKDVSVEYVTLELSGLCRRCRSAARTSEETGGAMA
jgi:Fur family transcriptional regulator, zinc uptake regulator